MNRIAIMQSLMLFVFVADGAWADTQYPASDFLIIAHRGASGYLPEHTLAAYRLAMEQGADFIELDLVVTKDSQLVCLHDISLSRTTDISRHKGFSTRRRELEGRLDWFVSDFKLAELKQLRTRQGHAGRNTEYDGLYEIPTFQEVIDLVRTFERETGREVGIYPELKAPRFFGRYNFPQLLLDELAANNLAKEKDRIFIQSFDHQVLRELRRQTDLPLVMLLRPSSWQNPGTPNVEPGDVAPFVDAVGASKFLILGRSGRDSGFIAEAESFGLTVHAWTVRNDQVHPAFEDVQDEISALKAVGVRGIFADFPDTAVQLRDSWRRKKNTR